MKSRKHVCAGMACTFAFLAFSSVATPNGWLDDFDAAKAKAAAEGKKILIDFSGSDWCGFCIKLDKEVLSKRAFMSKASQSFVLLLVDSPRNKGRLSPKARKENPGLVSKFGVRGYPTLVVTDAAGREIARKVGYASGGPDGLLAWLNTAAASDGNGAAKEALKRTGSKDATKRKPKIHFRLRTWGVRIRRYTKNLTGCGGVASCPSASVVIDCMERSAAAPNRRNA